MPGSHFSPVKAESLKVRPRQLYFLKIPMWLCCVPQALILPPCSPSVTDWAIRKCAQLGKLSCETGEDQWDRKGDETNLCLKQTVVKRHFPGRVLGTQKPAQGACLPWAPALDGKTDPWRALPRGETKPRDRGHRGGQSEKVSGARRGLPRVFREKSVFDKWEASRGTPLVGWW